MARLELRWRNNPFHVSQFSGRNDFLDFVVDDESLHELLKCGDRVGVLGGWFANAFFDAIYFRGLLLITPPYLESGRYELYVCPLCGDIGCGSITAEIEATERDVTWSDFAYEINYWFDDPSEMLIREGYEGIGSLVFDREQYFEALLAWPLRPQIA